MNTLVVIGLSAIPTAFVCLVLFLHSRYTRYKENKFWETVRVGTYADIEVKKAKKAKKTKK